MKRIYLLMALIMLAVISLNSVVLYLIVTRPTVAQVQKMVSEEVQKTSKELKSSFLKAQVLPVSGEKGEPGVTGKNGTIGTQGPSGEPGVPGKSIAGPKGDMGLPGSSGREIELSRDPKTGDLYSRYTGDTAWTLIGEFQ